MNAAKLRIAGVFSRTGLSRVLLSAQSVWPRPFIRAVNYHDVPPADADVFEAQIFSYLDRFQPVDLAQLEAFLDGTWQPSRPGLIVSFDDGLRSHAEVVAPILERHGVTGWFSIPANLPDSDVENHQQFRSGRHLSYDESDYADQRGVLSWDEVRELDRKHVIVCHSFNHTRLSDDLSEEDLHLEIAAAKAKLESELGHSVRAFSWVGGEEWSYSKRAADAIQAAGFDFSFMTNHLPIRQGTHPHRLQRSNIEASHSAELVDLVLCGAMDVLYTGKRRRLDRRLSVQD